MPDFSLSNQNSQRSAIIEALSYKFYQNKIQLSQTQFRVLFYMFEKANWDLNAIFLARTEDIRAATRLSLSQVKNSLQHLKVNDCIAVNNPNHFNRNLRDYRFTDCLKNILLENRYAQV